MSLPQCFAEPMEYFKEFINFLNKYQDLFKTANTDILIYDTLDKIKVEDLHNVDVFEEDFDLASIRSNNEFINKFFEELDKFKVSYDEFDGNSPLESNVTVPLSQKKKHEVIYLAKEIQGICDKSQCDVVVDLGSGLGYLDQLIYETTNLKVVGIESNENHYIGAKKRQKKYHADSLQNVKYLRHTINENSDRNIQDCLIEKFGMSNFCITGLHACADLTIDGVNLFIKMADAKSLILMPCCYHKMAVEDSEGRFKNFPLSSCLKGIFEEKRCWEYMKVPFLRLSAQPPSRDDNLEDLVFNLLARATLQLYAHRYNYKLKRNKRKAVRTKTINNNFSEYMMSAIHGFSLLPKNELSEGITEAHFDVENVENIWREKQNLRLKAAIFVSLQRSLQPVIENFVLYDRCLYLIENGVSNTSFKKIFNDKLSPRCLALISIK